MSFELLAKLGSTRGSRNSLSLSVRVTLAPEAQGAAVMREEVYRGYRIVYYRAGKWFARIYAPGSDVLLGDRNTTATVRETKSRLLERAQKRIDQDIAEQVLTERPQG